MMRLNPSYWRITRGPRWLRKLFCGRWTQEEVDEINRRAKERYDEMKKYTD